MGVEFDPTTGITADETATIREEIQDDWKAIFSDENHELNTDAETPAGQLIDSETALVAAKDTQLMYIANQFNPETAEGIWQEALGRIYFIARKIAQSTVVDCVCTGLYGTVIPKGSIVQNDDGYRLISTDEATIGTTGTVIVEFAAEETGAIEIAAGTVNTIITVIPNWDTVSNLAAGVVGREVESRFDFEKRRAESVSHNAHGTRAAIQATLLTLDGVLDCYVYNNPTDAVKTTHGITIPRHSVAICIYGGSNDDIAEAIYNKIGDGCGTSGNTTVTYTDEYGATESFQILRPTVTDVYIAVTIQKTDSTQSTATQDIKDAIFDDFYGNNTDSGNNRIGLGQTVYASRFSVPIIKTAGISDLVSCYIGTAASPTATSVTFNADIEPTLTKDNITVTINE